MGFEDDLFDDLDDFSGLDGLDFDDNNVSNTDNSGSSTFGNNSEDVDDSDLSFNGWSSDNSDINSDDDATFSNPDSDKKNIIKTSIIFVILGVVLLIITIVFSGIIKNMKNKNDTEYSGTAEITSEYEDTTSEYNNTTSEYNNTTSEYSNAAGNQGSNFNSKNDENGWKNFERNDEIIFTSQPVKLKFTVTKIDNYVKVANANNDLMVKTIATGALDGYSGTYEIELPYNKGSLLKPGAELTVEVQIGEYKGSSVIGEIVVI